MSTTRQLVKTAAGFLILNVLIPLIVGVVFGLQALFGALGICVLAWVLCHDRVHNKIEEGSAQLSRWGRRHRMVSFALVVLTGAIIGAILFGSAWVIGMRRPTPPLSSAPVGNNPVKPGPQPEPPGETEKPNTSPPTRSHTARPIQTLVVEARFICTLKKDKELPQPEVQFVDVGGSQTVIEGSQGDLRLISVSPVRYWRQEDNSIVAINRFTLPPGSEFIGRPPGSLSTLRMLKVVPQFWGTGNAFATFKSAVATIAVNGEQVWSGSVDGHNDAISEGQVPIASFPLNTLESPHPARKPFAGRIPEDAKATSSNPRPRPTPAPRSAAPFAAQLKLPIERQAQGVRQRIVYLTNTYKTNVLTTNFVFDTRGDAVLDVRDYDIPAVMRFLRDQGEVRIMSEEGDQITFEVMKENSTKQP